MPSDNISEIARQGVKMHIPPNSALYAKSGHSIALSEHNDQLPLMYRPRSRYNLSSRGASFPAFVPDISVDMIDETRHRQVLLSLGLF